MMYPRLKLAKNLLRDDGVVFVSIADHEIHNLRAVMDEVFGEENFVASVIWQKVLHPKIRPDIFPKITITSWFTPRSGDMGSSLASHRRNGGSLWKPRQRSARTLGFDNLTARNFYGAGTYSVTCPSGRVIDGPPSGRYWG
jgi:adenine-specific DNA-methyltransferase